MIATILQSEAGLAIASASLWNDKKLSEDISRNLQDGGEILFLDPDVSDRDVIITNLRPEVEVILLDADRPAARQIAEGLRGRHEIAAIHIMAHGAPGRLRFASDNWSSATLAKQANDLSSIGRALTDGGELRLWSCAVAAGSNGAAFIDSLARVTGADVAAATGRVGAAALGGAWELTHAQPHARPPITEAGVANYAGVAGRRLRHCHL